MAKIPLIIDRNYCSSWGVWHGIRELLQNAKDADEHDEHAMEVNHFPRSSRLEINSVNVQVNPAALLVLGKTSKSSGHYRGKFGEGFVLGVLALERAGCAVKFRNHELSWSVSFEAPDADHPLAGNELLTFHSRQLPAREPDFKIEINNITTEVWDVIKKLALFLDPPKADEYLKTGAGTLLLHPDRKSQVFVRGLFVRKFSDLECGYDLENVQLDRDRQMIDEWQLYYQLGDIWTRACEHSPSLMSPRLYGLAKANAAEVKHLHYHADQKLIANMREQFEQEHGQTTPVSTSAEAKEVARAGGNATMVSSTLKDLLEKGGLSIEATKKKLEGTVVKRWAPLDLPSRAYETSSKLETIVPNVVVVTFAGETPACHLIDDKKLVGVDHRLLDRPFKEVLAAALTEEAQRQGKSPFEVLLAHVAGEPVEEPTAPTSPALESDDGSSTETQD